MKNKTKKNFSEIMKKVDKIFVGLVLILFLVGSLECLNRKRKISQNPELNIATGVCTSVYFKKSKYNASYEFKVEEKTYKGTTTLRTRNVKQGDSLIIYYYVIDPKINYFKFRK